LNWGTKKPRRYGKCNQQKKNGSGEGWGTRGLGISSRQGTSPYQNKRRGKFGNTFDGLVFEWGRAPVKENLVELHQTTGGYFERDQREGMRKRGSGRIHRWRPPNS